MPISYSDTSSEGPEEDLGWAYADGNYGVSENCFCGRRIKVEFWSGDATSSPGRKYYICPAWFKECNGSHIFKWWDEAVEEQLGIVERKLEARMENMMRCHTSDPTIGEVKEEVRVLQGEVSRLKEEIAKAGKLESPCNGH